MLAEAERITLALYRRAAERCARAGLILADTKFELGHRPPTATWCWATRP